jgi:hypothetical protein
MAHRQCSNFFFVRFINYFGGVENHKTFFIFLKNIFHLFSLEEDSEVQNCQKISLSLTLSLQSILSITQCVSKFIYTFSMILLKQKFYLKICKLRFSQTDEERNILLTYTVSQYTVIFL